MIINMWPLSITIKIKDDRVPIEEEHILQWLKDWEQAQKWIEYQASLIKPMVHKRIWNVFFLEETMNEYIVFLIHKSNE